MTTEPASLTFSSTDWSTPKTVTVNAAQDADAEDETATVTHTVTSTDSIYSGASANSVAVTVTDDEVPVTVSFGATTYEVVEGETVTVTVILSADPERTVVIPITHAPQSGADSPADYSGIPESLTFNAGQMSQTITFTAAQDEVDDDGESVLLAIGTTLPSRVTQGATNETTVSITDDDDPQVAVSFDRASYRVLEGDTTTVGVTLSGDPERTVVIPLVATEEGGASSEDYSGVPSSVTINEGETSKTFEFMAMADDASDAGEGVMIGFGTSLPSRVVEGTPNEARVAINQRSTQLGSGAAVSFEMGAYTVSEGGTQAVTVILSTALSQTTVIPITATNQGGATSADYSGVPASVTFNAGEQLMSFNFMATQDDVDENCECVLLTFGALPSGVSAGPTDEAKVSIADIATTPEGTPTVPPEPFDLTAYGEDQSFIVRWEIPVGEDARAPVTSYRMRYRQVGASSWRNVSRANDGLTLWEDITGLTNRRAYEVQVAAVNRMGTGAWASVKGTPQAPYAPPPGPEGDEAFDVGQLRIYWLDPDADQTNVLHRESCTGSEDFRVFWTGPDGNRRADEWAVHINTRGGAGEVSYSFDESSGTPDGPYFSMNGTVNFEGDGALSLGVRGRFGSTWGTWWSPPVSLYCHEPEAPADTCSLQVQQQAVENTPAEGRPRIDGIPEVGQTLSADPTAIADADGLEEVVFQYQWLAEDADIAGATGSTYSLTSGDVGKAIKVQVTFTDDTGNEETLTSAPAAVTTAAGLQLQSATVDGATLTLTYSEVLDTDVTLPKSAFALNVNGSSRSLIGTGVGQSDVLVLLSSAVESGDTVTVDYTVPEGQDLIQDTHGRKAPSFSGQAVTNDTAKAPEDTASTAPLTATIHDQPSSHNGQDAFTFELRFSEDPQPDFSYTTVRDHVFTVTGGSVTYVRRLEPGRNVRWEVTVTPGSGADVALALNATTDCSAQGAICTEDGRMLSGGLQLAVPGPNTPATETPNTPATGLPSITGTAQVGYTLSAVTSGIEDADGLDNATFNHQWLADDAEIVGATGGSYILADADEGKTIKVQVSFTDDGGNDEILTSVATAAVAPKPNSPATGAPTISGTTQAGETLTSSITGISDGDGLATATFNYQWLADDADIAGATGSSYTTVAADAGKAIKVRVSFTDDAGNDEQLTSAGTGAVAAAPPPPNTPATGLPTIAGTAQVGETLTAGTTGISDADGLDNAAFAYQWLADDVEINGATASTYTLADADAGKAVKVKVTFTDAADNDEELTSAATGAVAAAPPPPNTLATGLPSITGTAQVGETLTAGTTDISDGDGLDNASFTYQWLADDVEINGATDSTYTLADADAGKAITVRVSFTDDAGNDEQLNSAGTGAVAAAPPPPNTPATGLPTIAGTAQVGETLTVDTTGISDGDGLDNAAFAYQWLADDVEINGATGSTYTLADADAGKAITVRVSFTDDAENDEQLTSAGTGAVAAAPPPPNTPATGLPAITGTAQVGETLTADTSGISDGDGLDNASFAYQWLGDDVEINGATGSTYTLADADEGKAITVRVSFTDDAENDEQLTSAGTGAVAAAPPPPNTPATGLPTIAGTAQVGETLTADTSGISDGDGLDNASFAYQWLADDVEINGATGSTYTLADADAGKAITVRVSFTDDAGNDEQLTSAGTGAVAAAPPPPNTPATGLPSISGTAQVGETLTADTSGISDGDGLDNASFAYQWLGDDVEINGATGSTYTLADADEGKAITVRVSFTDDAENDEQITSAGTGAVAAAPPPPNTPATGLPTIAGTAQVGETLTADTTGITDGDGLDNAAFAYQWLGDDVEINGATASTYTLADADAGKAITVRVSFTDDAGNDEQLTSAGTGAVAAAPPPPNTPATGLPTIAGTAQVGETLTADTSGISDGDGLDNASFAYQWLGDDVEINGATGSTYTLADADAGKAITVRVSFTDDAGNDEQITSAGTGAVAAAPPPPNTPATGLPAITGTAQVGETLTADATGISDGDGLDNATFTYQWLAADVEINGATGSTYTLADADEGKAIKVKVTFTDDAENDEQLTSAGTGAVAAAPPPPNTPATGLPAITGTAQVGETLTAGTTGISDGDGLDNAAFAYQWLGDDVEINGATGSTYTLADADEGKAITVRVSFTDDAGNDEQLTSAATGTVAAAVVIQPLTASTQSVPSSHDGSATFIFELRFSEELVSDFSYVAMRDHVLTVTGGSVTYVRRLGPPSNIGWEIHVTPDSDGALIIVLPVTGDCGSDGAICTEDGRMLSNRLEFTVNGP